MPSKLGKKGDAFYHSKKWKKCRSVYIAHRMSVDGGMCEKCHKKLGQIVHHKTYIDELNIDNPDITLSIDNLEYVCLDCHNLEHNERDVESDNVYTFDCNGELVPIRNGRRDSNSGAPEAIPPLKNSLFAAYEHRAQP